MSTYSNFLFEGEGCKPVLNDVTADSLIKDEDIKAAYEESSLEAGARCVMEVTQNWNNIMQACTIQEFNYLEENGAEMVYEGVILESFIDTVKKFFINLWEKIKSIFKKALMQFSSWVTSDKDFIAKYEKDIYRAVNNDLKKEDIEVSIYKDYVFLGKASFDKAAVAGITEIQKDTFSDVSSVSTIVPTIRVDNDSDEEQLKKACEAFDNDAMNDALETARAKYAKAIKTTTGSAYAFNDKSLNASEFRAELQNIFRGSDEKDDVAIKDAVQPAITFLKNSGKIKTSIDKGLKDAKKAIDDAIKATEKIAKNLDKDSTKKENNENDSKEGSRAGKKHTLMNKCISFMKSNRSMIIDIDSIALQELKNCSRQCKSVCVKVVSSAKVKKIGESGSVTTESSMSLLDGLELI